MEPMGAEAAEDRDLVASLLRGREERVFRELYRRHAPALYLLAARLLGGSGRGAEDAVQETWIRAAARLAHFRWESSLRTWLYGIAINRCREVLRERSTERRSEPIEADRIPATRSMARSGNDERIDLERAVRRLASGYREVLILHDLVGHTHEEIASMLDIDAGTSKSQLHKARRALRAALSAGAGFAARGGDEDA